MLFGNKLREKLENDIKQYQLQIEETKNEELRSYEQGYDADYTSRIRAFEKSISVCERKIAILKKGGLGTQNCIFDSQGVEHSYMWFTNKYGSRTIVCNDTFASSFNALTKKLPQGWEIRECQVPIWFSSDDNSEYRSAINMATGENVGYPQK